MFAASTYEEIESIERSVENKELVIFLFVKPTNNASKEIINEFEYIHYNSGKYCSIYAIGYTNNTDKPLDSSYREIETVCNSRWYFSNKMYVDFKERLERRIKWLYSGEIEVLILQNNPGSRSSLNFSNYVAINISNGIREGYIDSFQQFMEALIRSSKKNVTAKEAISDVANYRISVKDIIVGAINDCKKIPAPIKSIISDRLFYRCANSFHREDGVFKME